MDEERILSDLAARLDDLGFLSERDAIAEWLEYGPDDAVPNPLALLTVLRKDVWREIGDVPAEWVHDNPRPRDSDYDAWADFERADAVWGKRADAVAMESHHEAEREIDRAARLLAGSARERAAYPEPEERIWTGDDPDACPASAREASPDIARMKLTTVFAKGAGVRKRDLPAISSASAVARMVHDGWGDWDREVFLVFLLNQKNRILGVHEAAIGTLASVEVHPREALKAAVVAGARSIIVAHVHPSGDPAPSADDLAITKRLMDGADLLGIPLLDHLVVGEGEWRSVTTGDSGPLPD